MSEDEKAMTLTKVDGVQLLRVYREVFIDFTSQGPTFIGSFYKTKDPSMMQTPQYIP